MPLPVISITQMREWEKATWATGQTEQEVIRRVGQVIAGLALELTAPGDRILIVAGKGNNGQDALRARERMPDRRVEALEVDDPAADLGQLRALLSRKPRLVIDGLFGIGLNRPLSAAWIEFIETTNSANARVLAVDVPSGLNADTGQPQPTSIRADVTLTVGAPKTGLLLESAWDYVGRLEVASEVGLTSPPEGGELRWTVPADFTDFPPRRMAASHKGNYGHLTIVAGSVGFHGAAVLAARGAQRAQPGLITLHALEPIYEVVASQLQAVMVSPWRPQTRLASPGTALLAGPGLAAPDVPNDLIKSVTTVWRESEIPVVLDASALPWLPLGPVRHNAPRVITPHPGEAARLLGCAAEEVQGNRLQALRNLSRRFGNIWVVLKGHQTLVGCGTGEVYVNPSGNPHLSQGGSGDLLSGYIAGLIAQPALQGDVLPLLRYAVWQHGRAADRLSRAARNWTVEDLAVELGSQD